VAVSQTLATCVEKKEKEKSQKHNKGKVDVHWGRNLGNLFGKGRVFGKDPERR